MQKERQVLRPCQRTKKKLWSMIGAMIPIVIDILGTVRKGFKKLGGTGKVGNRRMSRNHPNNNII